ncbi:MAG: YidC/Oxa1 family membrane protein insertase [Lachnospiraceae bacterium]|nr:YidC/Oxa1 family membrane protein insertase [Lachnospiraceae bacterium]
MLAILTKYDGAFLGPIANILGHVMNGIFNFLDTIRLPNTGLSIILFTIVIYICMLPLTIKQQKFSKLSAKMNPEIQVIRDKYKGKKDQDSMQAMNSETQAVYAKYGVSQMGTCVQLLIQMPILFALYRVINNMPAYVTKIRDAFFPLVDKLIVSPGSSEFIQNRDNFRNTGMINMNKTFGSENYVAGEVTEHVQNAYIDVLNKATTLEFSMISETYPALAADVANTATSLDRYNNFLGINIGNAPSYMAIEAWNGGTNIAFFALIAAFIIPVLSAVTQWINIKLMPQQPTTGADGQPNQMMQSMKMMNTMMPLMSAFFCYTLPAGMGLYWVAGAVVRSIQQVIINRHIDKIDLDELIKKNVEKRKKKMEKLGIDPNKVNTYAALKTRTAGANANANAATIKSKANQQTSANLPQDKNDAEKAAPTNNNYKPGSLAAKANMVKDFNNRNK